MFTEREPNEDEAVGMTWWNGLSERSRELWLQRAASAVPAAAWALFKVDPGIAFEIGLQEGKELAQANAGNPQFGPEGVTLYLRPADQTRH